MATQAQVASHLDLTQQAVSQLLAAGVLPQGTGRAGLDLDACRTAYVRHLREIAAGRASEAAQAEGLDLVAERARLAKEQADHRAMLNAILRGELIMTQDLETVVGAIVDTTRTRILSIPTRAASVLAGITSRPAIRDTLTELVHDALTDLASTQIVCSVEARSQQGAAGQWREADRAERAAAPN